MSSENAPADQAWHATVMTLFPEMFPGTLGQSLAGRALDDGLWEIDAVDIRTFAEDKHQTVDDTPFGGGAGMVMRADVIDAALNSVATDARPIIYLSPRGKPLDQARVKELAAAEGVILLCGRYEGVDERVIEAWQLEEISLGDFVLSGGEPAALTLIDACVRLLPGVMGNEATPVEESFEGGLLEYPHYTRPREWQGRDVPEVLLSGHHENVKAWRQAEAEKITAERRPDLWDKYVTKGGTAPSKH
ncbi:MAG: tRNA (guanosine(37)-N1)-methyltransferase TrmD [Rhodospirillaceae bacterium]|nr:tRNA (guanosine(37)-N1)-methyltransferase TrmD [Rhodospirillaceae bacterium]MBT4590118.1 tRNA (guanosine(37)-N1)-methyltransferase TrmD [Rhodospirillaceae bacterium]MBT4938680.1 tRNA (guanosine(37)-N1)-methyltransferase TrmD [Rhodospirillaceae bacterium]MBT5940158.1 tRNA (guanosine(37)-N1)-methyltransferase TrmD [Rhodospirillaceae bacterium]MBT7266540.1 tRNA (guanosine(37)-N1)-methyltransferase TrmD [Rhodospirillaceae bacterium]